MTTITSNVTSLTVVASQPPPVVSGQVSQISFNTLSAVNPDPSNTAIYRGVSSGFPALVSGWTSGMYAPDFGGAYGSLICFGGGNGDYWGTSVYAFDIASGLWSRLDEPTTAMDGSGYSTDPNFDSTFGEHRGPVGTPFRYPTCWTPAVPHTYDTIAFEQKTTAYPKGRIILPMRFAIYKQGGSGQAHAYDLATRNWMRVSTAWVANGALNMEQGCSCIDTVRNRCWFAWAPGNGHIAYTDLTQGADPATVQHYVNQVLVPRAGVMRYYAAKDAIIVSAGVFHQGFPDDGQWGLFYMNPNNPNAGFQRLTVTGTTPQPLEHVGLGFAHVYEPTVPYDAFFMYQEGYKLVSETSPIWNHPQLIYKLTPPVGAVTGTWTCEAITMGGATVTSQVMAGSNGMYKRLSYASKAKAILWYSAVDSPVWAYQPEGLVP